MARDPDTSMGRGPREFPATPDFLRNQQSSWGGAWEELSRIYWRPVYNFVRFVWKVSNEEAKDLSQQFFLNLIRNRTVERYEPDRGAFRPFLKTCLRNFLLDEARRRARRSTVSIGEMDLPDESSDADREFDREWLRSLVEESLTRVREGLASEGRASLWSLYEAYELREPDQPKKTYVQIGKDFGMEEPQVRRALILVRARLKEEVLEQVRRSIPDPRDMAAELAHLGLI